MKMWSSPNYFGTFSFINYNEKVFTIIRFRETGTSEMGRQHFLTFFLSECIFLFTIKYLLFINNNKTVSNHLEIVKYAEKKGTNIWKRRSHPPGISLSGARKAIECINSDFSMEF